MDVISYIKRRCEQKCRATSKPFPKSLTWAELGKLFNEIFKESEVRSISVSDGMQKRVTLEMDDKNKVQLISAGGERHRGGIPDAYNMSVVMNPNPDTDDVSETEFMQTVFTRQVDNSEVKDNEIPEHYIPEE